MRVAIVEDERAWQANLSRFIKRYGQEKGLCFDVAIFSDGLDLLTDYCPVYDIIFLDIELPHSNGMDIAHRIRKMDENTVIIFITNMAQYAIKGYAVEALDFIVKPVGYSTFAFKLEKALRVASRKKEKELILNISGQAYKTVKISISSIFYFEVIGHCMIVHCASGDYKVWHSTLREMEETLKADSFVRCNASYLINLRHVDAVRGSVVRVGEAELAISRGKKQEFLEALSAYMGGDQLLEVKQLAEKI